MKYFVILTVYLFASVAQAAGSGFINGVVVSVYDGDTITLKVMGGRFDGQRKKIRFYGIDAPEAESKGRWKAQSYSEESKEFVERIALGQEVSVCLYGTSYDRIVGEVLVDGRSLSRELVRAGLAWWSEKYARYDYDLKRLQESAKNESLGLWAAENPVTPWGYRAASTARP